MVDRWRILLAALVIFVAGAATGAIAVRMYAPRVVTRIQPASPARSSQGPNHDYVSKMERELQLSPEQRQRIEAILKRSQERMKEIWRKDEFHRTRGEISAVLTPEQREKKKQMRQQREQKNLKHGEDKDGRKPEACLRAKCKAC